MACEAFGRPVSYRVISKFSMEVAGVFSKQVRELRELLPRYQHDNLFDSSKFKRRFADVDVTTYREGIQLIQREATNT